MKLFEINDAIKRVVDRDDLDPEMLKDTLDSFELIRDAKLDEQAGLIESEGQTLIFFLTILKTE